MSTTIKITDLPEFDPAEYLTDEQEIAAYLSAVLAKKIRGYWPLHWAILPARVA